MQENRKYWTTTYNNMTTYHKLSWDNNFNSYSPNYM